MQPIQNFSFTPAALTPAPIDSSYEGKPETEYTYLDYPIKPADESDYLKRVLDNRKCFICLDLPHKAHRICQIDAHRICQKCLKQYKTEQVCPSRCPRTEAYPLLQVQEDLEAVQIACPYHVDCHGKLSIADIIAHEESAAHGEPSANNQHDPLLSQDDSETRDTIQTINPAFFREQLGLDLFTKEKVKDTRPETHLARCPFRPIICRGCKKAVPETVYREKHIKTGLCPESRVCEICSEGVLKDDEEHHKNLCVQIRVRNQLPRERGQRKRPRSAQGHSQQIGSSVNLEHELMTASSVMTDQQELIFELAHRTLRNCRKTQALETTLSEHKQWIERLVYRSDDLISQRDELNKKYALAKFEHAQTKYQNTIEKKRLMREPWAHGLNNLSRVEIQEIHPQGTGVTLFNTKEPGVHLLHIQTSEIVATGSPTKSIVTTDHNNKLELGIALSQDHLTLSFHRVKKPGEEHQRQPKTALQADSYFPPSACLSGFSGAIWESPWKTRQDYQPEEFPASTSATAEFTGQRDNTRPQDLIIIFSLKDKNDW